MSKEKTPHDELLTQYKREYKRISQAIRRQSKLGYHIPTDLHPISPSRVGRVTQSDVDELISLTPEKIRKNSYYINPETGEAIFGLDIIHSHREAKASTAKVRQSKPRTSAIKAPTQRKRKRTKKSNHPDRIPSKEVTLNTQIIEDTTAKIKALSPWGFTATFRESKHQWKGTLLGLWSETLKTEGEYEVAYRLQGKAAELNAYIDALWVASKADIEKFNYSGFAELVRGKPLSADESDHFSETGAAYVALWKTHGEE